MPDDIKMCSCKNIMHAVRTIGNGIWQCPVCRGVGSDLVVNLKKLKVIWPTKKDIKHCSRKVYYANKRWNEAVDACKSSFQDAKEQ